MSKEMRNLLIFNKKRYSFSPENLLSIFRCMLENDSLNEDDGLFSLSFVTNKIVRKTYDDLDYHEFILQGSFEVSNLLCNIYNVFGEEKAITYAESLSSFLDEDIEIDSTDCFNSISTTDAALVGKRVFISKEESSKFQMLLALLHLYHCAQEDYEQQIEDVDGFDNLLFINGIGVKKLEHNGKLMLKPVYDLYDCSISEYIEFSGILAPPSVWTVVFKSGYEVSTSGNISVSFNKSKFFLKIEQLTGQELKLPKPKLDFSSWSLDRELFGKWYNVYESDAPFGPKYHFSVYWFEENGSFKQSVVFDSSLKPSFIENWRPKKSLWKSNGRVMVIHPGDREECQLEYKVEGSTLTLHTTKYFRTLEEAINAIK